MERDSQNMDDFIRKGLESFGDEPSNMVWEGLSSRIQAEKPFYQQSTWRTKAGITALLGLLLLGNIYFGYQWKTSLDTSKALQTENEELRNAVEEANNSIFEIGTIIDLYDQDKKDAIAIEKAPENSIEKEVKKEQEVNIPVKQEMAPNTTSVSSPKISNPQPKTMPIAPSPIKGKVETIIEAVAPIMKDTTPIKAPEPNPNEFKDIEVPIMAIDRPADSPNCAGCMPKIPESMMDTLDFEEMIKSSLKEWKEEHLPKVKIFKRENKE